MNITRVINRTGLLLSKNSPKILFAAGVAGSVATVVVACKATLKLPEIQKDRQEWLETFDAAAGKSAAYASEDYRKDVTKLTGQTWARVARLYMPAAVLGVASIVCLTRSHQILTNRNVALTAAYTGLDKFIKDYRSRVTEELGAEKDAEFAFGVSEKEVIETDAKGRDHIKKVKVYGEGHQGLYQRFFDEGNRYWQKEHGFNHTFLDGCQVWLNTELKRRGHLFLNEVFDEIGFERTPEGQELGWIYDSERGDGYVDFGFNRYPDFVAGFERSVLLDFNCDGPILSLI